MVATILGRRFPLIQVLGGVNKERIVTRENDSSTPGFWEQRFLDGRTPWDAGGVPRELLAYLAQPQASGRVLIPGCGAAYEVVAFHQAGHKVVAIDFSQAALTAARATLGSLYGEVACLGDFFHHEFEPQSFHLIYERAFLCSLPRRLWLRYVARVAELLKPGGLLIGFFYFDNKEEGPPFGLRKGGLGMLLNDHFTVEIDEPASNSAPIFAGRERWMCWRRDY
jgi:SAM-dependent methyltransferase